jgi:MoaA/NifB/PqqE/SkfB family radical SAM enzyme
MKTVSIDYMINPKCNLNCPFCYGSRRETAILKKEDKLSLICQLSKIENLRLIFGGGEPLIDDDILDICKLAKELNIKIAIQTNGTFPVILQSILPYVDWVGLPIDGISLKSQKILRTNNHVKKVKQCLDNIFKYKRDTGSVFPKIKIGTVINKINIFELNDISNFIRQYDIDIWKIYKLRKRGKMSDETSYSALNVEEEAINNIICSIIENSSTSVYYSNLTDSDSYLIIEPDSEVVVIRDSKMISVGYLFENSTLKEDVIQQALTIYNNKLSTWNIEKSFPKWK